jgi:ribosomal protein S18 acetylase RimI-like enzyme
MSDMRAIALGLDLVIGGAVDAEQAADLWERANAAREGRPAVPVPEEALVEMIRSRVSPDSSIFVLFKKGDHVVGVALGEAAKTDGGRGDEIPGVAHVTFVAVDPPLWGQGLGRILMERLDVLLLDAGYVNADLGVLVSNERAVSLYSRSGWMPVDPTYPHPKSGQLMQRYVKTLTSEHPEGPQHTGAT